MINVEPAIPAMTMTPTESVLADSAEGQSFHVGIAYDTGAWRIGGGYFYGASEGSLGDPGEDISHFATGGIQYTLAPGIRAQASIIYGHTEDEGGAVNEGVVGAAGLRFSF